MGSLIYIVEDSSALRELLTEVLEDYGFEAQSFSDALTAHAAIRRAPPDLVIIDLFLGTEPRGIDLLRTIRGDPETLELPSIIISAEDQALRRHKRVLDDLNCRTLEKPFLHETLVDLIKALLNPPSRQIGMGSS